MGGETKEQEIFVDPAGVAIIECPACSLKKKTSIDSTAIRRKSLQSHCLVRCTCQAKFAVKLEFRRDLRKSSNFTGEFLSLPRGEIRGGMQVVNISRNGIGLHIKGASQFNVGDQILALFTLDGNEDALIEKRATVRFVEKDYVGCEFQGSFPLGKALGDYLARDAKEQGAEAAEDDGQFDWSDRSLK